MRKKETKNKGDNNRLLVYNLSIFHDENIINIDGWWVSDYVKMSTCIVPASISYTAGTYVCNDLMYAVLYHIDKEFKEAKGGFMYVPFLHDQVMAKPNTPSLSLNDVVKAIEAAISAIVNN